jgi:fatty acid desaturase
MVSANPDEARGEAWLEELAEQGRPLTDKSNHWRHNAINLASLALLLAVVPGSYLAFRRLPTPLAIAMMGLVNGTVVFSLFTLVVHEASHDQFLVVRSERLCRRLNDVFGWAVCLLFTRDYEVHWRVGHNVHHRRVLEDDDPQNCAKYVLEGRELLTKLAKVWLIPLYELEVYRLWMKGLDDRCPKPEASYDAGPWLRGAGFLVGWTVILFVPFREAPVATLITTLVAIKMAITLNFLKSSFEHGGGYREVEDQRLKTRGLIFPLKDLCFPFCITPYHWEHHLVPGIPWYRLPRYRRAIAHQVPDAWRDWIFTPGPVLLQRVLLP